MRISGFLISALLAALGLAGSATAAEDAPFRPRPLSEAERRAVVLATAYLENGAPAWWDELSSDAPLRALGRETATAEMAVRAGPRQGARWQLQTPGLVHGEGAAVFTIEFPSGIDETLRLELVERGGTWRLHQVISLVDAEPIRPATKDFLRGAARPALPGGGASWPAAAILLLVGTAVILAPRRLRGVALAAALAGAGVFACGRGSSPDGTAGGKTPSPALLSALAPLREVLTGGSDAQRTAPFRALSEDGLQGVVGQLWEAQYLLAQDQIKEAQAILARLPSPSEIPLDSLLRARLASALSQDETLAAYDQAVLHGSDHDGVRLEAAVAALSAGEIDESDHRFLELGGMGSRLGEVYYALAGLSSFRGDEERAKQHFETAWKLQPKERRELFANPTFGALAIQPEFLPKLQLSSADEPVVEVPAGDRALPELLTLETSLLGAELTIKAGAGLLVVPSGAEVAPATAKSLDAGTRSREEEAEALAAVESLPGGAGAALTRPRRRHQIHVAAEVLATSRRWEDLLKLTDGLASHVDRAPPELVQLRAQALKETGKEGAASKLLIALAKSDAANRRRDPVTFYQLGELMAAAGEYDLAVRLMQKVNALSAIEIAGARIRQLNMEKSLAESYKSYESEHFDIRYPAATGEKYARDLAFVLESERRRLLRWIPLRSAEKVEVDLFPLQQFMESYSQGVMVLGLFDGRVRVPFADLKSLHPYLVAVLSHELAHALITEYTGDQTPKWFHEGLAQHIQMVQDTLNPIPDMLPEGRALAFPLIEAVLTGFAEPQVVDLAYNEATWVAHFIEARYGVEGIHKLLDAFAAGKPTPEALVQAFGLTPREFEKAAWDWCLKKAPTAWSVPLLRYDKELNPYVRRSQVAAAMPKSAPEREIPQVRTRTAPKRESHRDDKADLMKRWHTAYSAKARPVKLALAPVVQAFRGGAVPTDLPGACHRLEEELNAFLADDGVFETPNRSTNWQLKKAYRSFLAAASACRRGRDATVRNELKKAEEALGVVARSLAPYGLRP